MSSDGPVIVARIARAHGTRGALLLEAETDHAEALFQPGRRLRVVPGPEAAARRDGEAGPGARTAARAVVQSLTLRSARPHAGRWLVEVEEVADRTLAEALRGATLTVPRQALPELADDEYLLHDLIGMAVRQDSETLGVVRDVFDQPGAPLLAVEVDGRERLIPFHDGLVDEVDLEGREIRVTLPAGLLDL